MENREMVGKMIAAAVTTGGKGGVEAASEVGGDTRV